MGHFWRFAVYMTKHLGTCKRDINGGDSAQRRGYVFQAAEQGAG
jgi:hypothetical protein